MEACRPVGRRLAIVSPLRNEIPAIAWTAQMTFAGNTAMDWLGIVGKEDAEFGCLSIPHSHAAPARCELARILVEQEAEWALWLDDDQVPPANSFKRLWTVADALRTQGVKVGGVAGVYFTKSDPYHTLTKEVGAGEHEWLDIIEEEHPSVIEIAGSGFGLMLTPIEVLRDVIAGHGAASAFVMRPGCGEDVDFMNKARVLGYHFFAIPKLVAGHVKQEIVDEEFVEDWKYR